MALAKCKYSDCGAELDVEDVQSVRAIPKAPHHVAVVAACAVCGRPSQVVVERGDWLEAGAAPTKEDLVLRGAIIDLEFVDTVEDLKREWAALGPPLMEVRNKCDCPGCRARRYGKR